jgi:hypothetical protein
MESSTGPREVILKPKAPPAVLLQAATVAKQALPVGEGHVTLFEDKITVRDSTMDDATPRRYTLTHSDRSAQLSLSIGPEHDQEAVEQSPARDRHDEVLAELTDGEQPRLQVVCQVGSDDWGDPAASLAQRRRIFEKELPLALAVIRYGDRFFYERHPDLDRAEVEVEFRYPDHSDRKTYGRVTDYRVTRIAGESRRLVAGAAALAAVGIGALVMRKMRKQEWFRYSGIQVFRYSGLRVLNI